MSSAEKAYGLIKSVMLMNERFDGLEERIRTVSTDVGALAASHAELAQRVARIEGVMEGYARASAAASPARRLPKK